MVRSIFAVRAGDQVVVCYGRWRDRRGKVVGFGPPGLIHVLLDEAGEVMARRWSLRLDP